MNLTTLATSFQSYFAAVQNILTVKYISSLVTEPVLLEVGRTNFFNDREYVHLLPDPEDCGSGCYIDLIAFSNLGARIAIKQKSETGLQAEIRWSNGKSFLTTDELIIDLPGTFKLRSVVTTNSSGVITEKYWRI